MTDTKAPFYNNKAINVKYFTPYLLPSYTPYIFLMLNRKTIRKNFDIN